MNIVWMSWKDGCHPEAGGAEVVQTQLAQRLAADGHSLTIITAAYPGAAAREQRDGYTIVRLPNPFRLGVYLAAWRYYRTHRTQLRPDLVIDEMNTIPFMARRYSHVPTLLLAHQLARQVWFHEMFFPLNIFGWLLEPVFIWLIKKSPCITVSESSRRDLARFGLDTARIHIIPEAITIKPLPALPKPPPDPPRMLVFGAIRSMKGTLDAVKAFELAKQTIPAMQLDVAGAPLGSYGKKVLAYIARSPHAADITVHGKVSAEQKITLMRQATILVSAARKEGWGLTVTEAASQGVLPVVYDVDGLRDAVFLGKGGLLSQPHPQSLSAAIIDALQSDHTAERLYAYQQSKRMTFDRTYTQFKSIIATYAATDQRN